MNVKENLQKIALDDRIKELLDQYEVELVVLAGYMLLLKGKTLLEAYKNKIINIHPALLPKHPDSSSALCHSLS